MIDPSSSKQKQDYSSREIKFRAWDKRAKKWRVIITLCWYEPETGKAGLCGAIVADDNGKQGLFMPIEYLGVVQYTGQHSIDNVEVYDRDLLRFPDHNETYEVRWDNQEGAWGITYNGMHYSKIGTARFMQIAGNVCANPELVETDYI